MYGRLRVGICVAALIASGGCALPDSLRNTAAATSAATANPGSEPLLLSYHTDSDRLNVATVRPQAAVQPAAYTQTVSLQIPPLTRSKLSLQYPHPQGRPDMALAVLTVDRKGDSSNEVTAFWNKITGHANIASSRPAPLEVWALDIPKQELDLMVVELRRDNFFRRSKVMGVKAFVGTEIDGVRFGKDYHEIAAFDALILRVRSQGTLVQASPLAPAQVLVAQTPTYSSPWPPLAPDARASTLVR